MTETTSSRPGCTSVDVPTWFASLDAVKTNPQISDFQTHNRTTTIQRSYRAGQKNISRIESSEHDANQPAVLADTNQGQTPVELLLHAIAACITAGLANIAAAAKGITLHRVESTVKGDINLLDVLGLDSDSPNGWRQIRVNFTVDGDATPECGRSSNSPGSRSRNSPGLARRWMLLRVRGGLGDDASGSLVRPVAGPVHEDLVAGVDEPVE
jgi:uncharacterized OsmC-like protein